MTAQFGPALPDQDVGFAFAETIDAVAGADLVASDSGGFTVRNTNDLGKGIQRIADETQAYYLLGYVPQNAARDGKFRKIQVKLANGKGLQVRARKGYYAPGEAGKSAFQPKKGVDPVIQSALDSPWAEDAIPLRMTHYVGDEKTLGKAAVLVATEVDVRGLQLEEKEGRVFADVQFLLVVAHRESGEFFRYDQAVNMKLLPSTRERLKRLWFPIVRDFELKSGRLPGEDRGPRHPLGAGGHRHPRVRGAAARRAARLDPGAERHPRDHRRPRRAFPAGSCPCWPAASSPRAPTCSCQFEVYGAKKDEKTGMPRVTQGLRREEARRGGPHRAWSRARSTRRPSARSCGRSASSSPTCRPATTRS